MNTKYTVGTQVGYARYHMGTPIRYGFSTVQHVNGHGHIRLENGLVFDKYGDERGTGMPQRLMDASALQTDLDLRAARKARHNKIEEIRKLVDQLAHSDDPKVQLTQLIESL